MNSHESEDCEGDSHRCELCRFFEAEYTQLVENEYGTKEIKMDLCRECLDKAFGHARGEDVEFDTEMRLRERDTNA